jgi:hypothetical protein
VNNHPLLSIGEIILFYVIQNQSMAGYLMVNGFKLHKIEVSKKDPSRDVFLFEDTEKLRQAMSEFKK